MSSGGQRRRRGFRRGPRQDLTLTLLLGAAGAGLIFLASKQGWATVTTIPPKPLPASRVSVSGSSLVPFLDALVVAGLATLAAVLATRGLARRLAGVVLALIGAGLAASAFTLSASSAVSAADSTASPAAAAAGSVMDGSGTAPSSVPNVAGTAPHVVFAASAWQAMVVAGALAMILAGLVVIWRAGRMAVMSSRYDSPTRAERPAEKVSASADSASIWEALSRGDDPTWAGD